MVLPERSKMAKKYKRSSGPVPFSVPVAVTVSQTDNRRTLWNAASFLHEMSAVQPDRLAKLISPPTTDTHTHRCLESLKVDSTFQAEITWCHQTRHSKNKNDGGVSCPTRTDATGEWVSQTWGVLSSTHLSVCLSWQRQVRSQCMPYLPCAHIRSLQCGPLKPGSHRQPPSML